MKKPQQDAARESLTTDDFIFGTWFLSSKWDGIRHVFTPLSSGNGKGNIKTIKAFMVTKKCNNNNGVNNNKTNHKSEGEQPGY